MQDIDLLSYVTNLCSGVVCLVLGILLLFYHTEQKEDRMGYVNVKRFLAIAAFLAASSNVLVIWMLVERMDFRFLLTFVVPCICYWQLHASTIALLSLIHSPKSVTASRFYWVLPILLLSIAHVIGFALYDGEGVGLGRYAYYCCTTFSQYATWALFITIGLEFFFYASLLLTEVHRFNHKIDNYFTGRAELQAKALAAIVRCFLAYFLFAGLDMIISSQLEEDVAFILNAVLMCINMGAFIVAVIVILNMQHTYFSSTPAFTIDEESNEEEDTDTLRTEEEATPLNGGMEQKVAQWCANPEKHYLAESITLAEVAEEMRVSPRLLSSFLNSVHGQNFNMWINTLRVEEVKRILTEEPSTTMTDIACRTGFTDASALSRTFKRLAGYTPTHYRNKMLQRPA